MSTLSGKDQAIVYMPGDAILRRAFSPIFQIVDDKYISGNYSRYLTGPFSEFDLSPKTAASLNKYGFKQASKLLEKDKNQRTEMQSRVLSALQWAGRATFNELSNRRLQEEANLRREEAFMLYAISLESLLLKKGSEVTYRFSMYGAQLLGKNLMQKQSICARLQSLYNIRSEIVHSGRTEISDEDLSYMRWFAKSAVHRVLTSRELSKIERFNDFTEWLERRMLK